jgi:hypothetical protein
MMLAIFLRDVLRLPISLVFTSAAKHQHSWFPRWLIANMDGVISTTPEAASYVPNTTRVVPHGISLERFSPPENKLTVWQRTGLAGRYGIGVFGRVRPDKGSDIYVQAMLELLPDFPDFTAVIAGVTSEMDKAAKTNAWKADEITAYTKAIFGVGDGVDAVAEKWDSPDIRGAAIRRIAQKDTAKVSEEETQADTSGGTNQRFTARCYTECDSNGQQKKTQNAGGNERGAWHHLGVNLLLVELLEGETPAHEISDRGHEYRVGQRMPQKFWILESVQKTGPRFSYKARVAHIH